MDGGGAGGGPEDRRLAGSKLAITAAAMAGASMAILDISIVNVGLSDIRASFGAPLDQMAWVSTGYMMANVVVIPMTGWFQRRFGFRAYYATSLLLFSLASALCAAAWDLPSLVCFRVLQGLGGGAIIPTAQSILLGRYPREEHGLAGALFGLGAMTGPLLGPSLGGYLIDAASWPWIFLVNVPLGLLSALLTWRHLREPGRDGALAPGRGGPAPGGPAPARCRPPVFDGWGVLLLIVAMAGLQYVLEEGNRRDWWRDQTIRCCAAASAAALLAFLVHELETPDPVVDLRVFRSRNYAAATAMNFLVGVASFSAAYLFSLYCGTVMRYAAIDIGRVFLVAGAVQLLLLPAIGVYGARSDGRKLAAVGVMATALALWLHSRLSTEAGFVDLVRPRFVLSVGLAFLYVPLGLLALSDLPPGERGGAAGLFNLTRELGGSVGTACMSVMLTDRGRLHGARLAEGLTSARGVAEAQLSLLSARVAAAPRDPWADPLRSALSLARQRVERQALAMAFCDAFLVVAAAFAVSVLILLLMRRQRG